MKQRKSNIPHNVTEHIIRAYRAEGSLAYYRLTECILDGQVVGQRAYDHDGSLMIETPLKNGKKHGREYTWSEDGALLSIEPYAEGKIHGLAKQFSRNGKIIGTYRLVHGTGFDIWRHEQIDGSILISEIHNMQDGLKDGYEWWLNSDQQTVWHERHWRNGLYHGIERIWNEKGKLRRGYPKYWINGKAVKKRAYVEASQKDQALPRFQERDNQFQRRFPTEINKILPM